MHWARLVVAIRICSVKLCEIVQVQMFHGDDVSKVGAKCTAAEAMLSALRRDILEAINNGENVSDKIEVSVHSLITTSY